MSQPLRTSTLKKTKKTVRKKKIVGGHFEKRKHPEYGTSKLEKRFAKNFLEKLGVDYIYQYKAESIGRYYDFCIPSALILIEIDGDYFHAKNLLWEQMNPMQKHNRKVDKEKDHWAIINGFFLIRIWEEDINKRPDKVMKMLKERIFFGQEDKNKKDKKKRNPKK